MDVGGLFANAESDSAVVLDTGAMANLIRSSWLERHNCILRKRGLPRTSTYPASARFRYRNARQGELRRAEDIPVGATGNKWKFRAFALETYVPALLRKGALEAPGGQVDTPKSILTLRKQAVDIFLGVNGAGQ